MASDRFGWLRPVTCRVCDHEASSTAELPNSTISTTVKVAEPLYHVRDAYHPAQFGSAEYHPQHQRASWEHPLDHGIDTAGSMITTQASFSGCASLTNLSMDASGSGGVLTSSHLLSS